MPARLRLQRKGKKRAPYYHIVAADVRAPRDGKYIERLGFYDPNTNPASIEIDREKALQWLKNGAQPTDTMRAILKYTGVLYQKHLEGGVNKGALTQEEADQKLSAWLRDKETKIAAKRESILTDINSKATATLDAEKKIKEERAAKILAKTSALAAAAEESSAEGTEETVPAEASTEVADTPAAETTTATETAPAEEPQTEAPADATPAAETTPAEEAPVTETAPADEAPVAETTPAEEGPVAETAPADEAPVAENKPAEEPKKEEKPAEGDAPAAEENKGE